MDASAPKPKEQLPPAGLRSVRKKGAKDTKVGRPRNYALIPGLMRFSKSRMYKRKALYKKIKHGKKPRAEMLKPKPFIKKEVGTGDKKGVRNVRVKKHPKIIHPEGAPKPRLRKKRAVSRRPPPLRKTLVPGTVCILLAGRHKGKRVVFLKQLRSGLMLVNGPFRVNRCPLRRISQTFVIATSTRIDLGNYEVPKHINDHYFRRIKLGKKKGDDIFDTKKERYVVSDQRKADQKDVDKVILTAMRKHADHKLLWKYMRAVFGLRHGMLPHKLKF